MTPLVSGEYLAGTSHVAPSSGNRALCVEPVAGRLHPELQRRREQRGANYQRRTATGRARRFRRTSTSRPNGAHAVAVVERPAKLVAFDVDGTLVGRDLSISKGVREGGCADAARRRRRLFVTGECIARRYHSPANSSSMHRWSAIKALRSSIRQATKSWRIRRSRTISFWSWFTLAERDRIHLQLYSQRRVLLRSAQPVLGTLRVALHDATRNRSVAARSFRLQPGYQGLVIADEPIAARYAEKLAEIFKGRANVTRSLPEFVEVLDPAAEQRRRVALRRRADGDRPSRQRSRSATPGTTRRCSRLRGLGSRWDRAPPELKAIRDAVVGDLAHDGVAEAIEKYVLQCA